MELDPILKTWLKDSWIWKKGNSLLPPTSPTPTSVKKLAKVIHYVEGRYYSFSMYIYGKALKGEFFLE